MTISRKPPRSLTDGGGVQGVSSQSGLGERGLATVEYTVLLVLVALVCALAVVALGVPFVKMYELQTAWLLLRLP